MAVEFRPVSPQPLEQCTICLEPLTERVVAHTKGGEKHCMHEECIKQWAIQHFQCPVCREEVNLSFFGTRLERIKWSMKPKCKVILDNLLEIILW